MEIIFYKRNDKKKPHSPLLKTMEKSFNEYVKILPKHSDNLLNFYIFLAYTKKLTFYKREEHDINSFFYRKSASIFL